ncbi:MAG: hypothetical protein QXG55_05410 [Thermoplasmata archaeon]
MDVKIPTNRCQPGNSYKNASPTTNPRIKAFAGIFFFWCRSAKVLGA